MAWRTTAPPTLDPVPVGAGRRQRRRHVHARPGKYDGAGGDLLIKLIFEERPTAWWASRTPSTTSTRRPAADLRTATEIVQGLGRSRSTSTPRAPDLYDIQAVDFGDPAFTRWTIDIANENVLLEPRHLQGAMSDAKWEHFRRVPPQTALPFGTSVRGVQEPGSDLLDQSGSELRPTQVAPHTGSTHWYGGL